MCRYRPPNGLRLAARVCIPLTGLVPWVAVPAAAAVPTPKPSATPSPQASWIAPQPQPQQGECGWLDVGCKVNEAVNGWFTDVVKDAISPAFSLVGRILLSSPPPSMLVRVRELAGHVAFVANALLVLFVLAGGLIVMAYGSVQTSTTAKEVAPRLAVSAILLNGSLTVSEYAIRLANGLVEGLLGDGADPVRAGNLLAGKVLGLVSDPKGTVVYLVLMAGVAVLMGTILVFVAIIRITLLLFLVISAPLALLCHALPQTEGIARLWWRGFAGVLAIQVLQALVLILAFKIHLTQPEHAFTTGSAAASLPAVQKAADVLILIGLLYVMVKIPGWVARTIWQQAKPQLLVRLVKALVVYKSLGAVGAALRGPGRVPAAHRGPGPAGGGSRTGRGSGPSPRLGPSRGRRGPTAPPHPSPTGRTMSGHATLSAGPTAQPRQLSLPITIPSAGRNRQGTQLALPFTVRRVPRPTAAPSPPPVPSTWIRPKPPYVQDRLPGMPTRQARPRQLHLRLDPPPRRVPRGGSR